MMKKLKHNVIFILIIMLVFALPINSAYADTPKNMTRPQVVDRLDQLYEDLGGKYFTTTQKAATANDSSDCAVGNVVQKSWLKTATDGMIPANIKASGSFCHFYNGKSLVRGYSCCGFANYAQWYVFAQDAKDVVIPKEIAFKSFNYSNMLKYAQPGDVIRVGNSKSSSVHSAIVYSINDDSVTVIDGNWTTGSNKCKVTKHTIKYTSYTYVGITRAGNYDYPTGHYVIEETSSGTLIMRDGPSSDYTLFTRVPSGTKVKVTETKGNWGKYEYNGISGWSNMDYMYFSGTYINAITFEANGGKGTMNNMTFDVGTGFTVPQCGFTKKGYHFTGWYMEIEGTGHWRCKDSVANVLDWLTESEIKGNFEKHLYRADTPSNMKSHILKAGTYIMHAQWEPCSYGDPAITPATYGSNGAYVYACTTCQGTYKEAIPAVKTVTLSQTKYTYSDAAKKPTVTVKDANGNQLVKDTDYTVSYSSNLNPGEGKVIIKLKGEYTGTLTKPFSIVLPAPQISVQNVVSTGKPKVTWDAVDKASKYEVWRAVGANGTYEKYYTTTGTSLINTSTTPGTIYYYKVKAICGSNSCGNSALSNKVYIACDLPQPKNVKVAPVISTGKPKLTWDAVDGASKYEVWRAVGANGTYEKYYTTTGTSLINTSTTPGTIYYYKVKAICGSNRGGNSALSNKVYMACDLPQPKATIKLNSNGKPVVSWCAVNGAAKYEVWRAVGPNGTYEKYYTTTGLALTNTSAKKGTTYYYKIKAICGSNSGGNSALSNKVYITSK